MQTKKSSNLAIALIWFTAAISMAEILTGTWFAPLGWQQGLIAIVVGHFIGGSMFFCAGYIGAKTQKSAMQTVQISFGEKGSALFSLLNAMQLMGWTAVMIYMGAEVISILNQTADASIFPFLTLVIQLLHDSKGKVMSFWCSVRVASHTYTHLMKAGIAKRDGGITIV